MPGPVSSVAKSVEAAAAAPSRTVFERTIAMTPVVMTVVATLLAGLSTSEMTLAQYHRSLAAQQQSKAGDQWGYFQAKRIRGTSLELAADLLPAAGDLNPQGLRLIAAQLDEQWRRAQTQAGKLDSAAAEANSHLPSALREQFLPELDRKLKEGLAAQAKFTSLLASSEAQTVLEAPGPVRLPTMPAVSSEHPKIKVAVKLLTARKSESDLAVVVGEIEGADLETALATAQDRAATFSEQARTTGKALDRLVAVATAGATEATHAQRTMRQINHLTSADDKASGLRSSITELTRAVTEVKDQADEQLRDLRAARYSYRARTYEREARDNEVLAGLYELQVRKSDEIAERHRRRSKHFFYGMLLAQAGVTIASLSLALRGRSLLWLIAGITGLVAIGFSGYVYLFL